MKIPSHIMSSKNKISNEEINQKRWFIIKLLGMILEYVTKTFNGF